MKVTMFPEAELFRVAELKFLRAEAKTVGGDIEQVYFDLLPRSVDPIDEATQDPAAWDVWVRTLWQARGFTVPIDFRDDNVTSPSGRRAHLIIRNGEDSKWTGAIQPEDIAFGLSEVESMRALRAHVFSVYWRSEVTLASLISQLESIIPTSDITLWPRSRDIVKFPINPNDYASTSP